MSIFEEIDSEQLSKKLEFLESITEKFSDKEKQAHRLIRQRFWAVANKTWTYKKQILQLQAQIQSALAATKKQNWWMVAVIIIIVTINFLSGGSTIDLGFTSLGFGGYWIYISYINHIARMSEFSEIENIKRTIDILNIQLSDLDLKYVNYEQVMPLLENNMSHTEYENKSIREFNIELELSIIESMGYTRPILWT